MSSLKSPVHPSSLEDKHFDQMVMNVAKAIVSNKLVLFIGAGLSSSLDLPSWKGLVEKLCKGITLTDSQKSVLEDLRNNNQYSVALDRLAEYANANPGTSKSELRDFTREMMSDIPDDGPRIKFQSKSYVYLSELYDLGARKIVTTNYDKSIEICIGRNKITPVIPDSNKSSEIIKLIKEQDEFYIKLHGGVEDRENDSMVLFEEDYRNKYILDDLIPSLLKELFTHYSVLFLGCGLSERYMDIYESLNARNNVLPSYVICKPDEHKLVVERNSLKKIKLDDYSQFDRVLERILVETRKEQRKKSMEMLFSELPLADYDYQSAKSFFEYVSKKEVTSCFFFNTQVRFSEWFSPVLQLHLSQQMEAYCRHMKTRSKKFKHYRLLFLPFTREEFFRELSTDSFLQEIKVMIKVHQSMDCPLVFITTDDFASIIEENVDFFNAKSRLDDLGLGGIGDMDLACINPKDLDLIILNQSNNGYRKTKDLDFAVTIKEDKPALGTAQIWQANFGKGPMNRKFAYSGIDVKKEPTYKDFSKRVIQFVLDNLSLLANPRYVDKDSNVFRLNDYVDLGLDEYLKSYA